MKKNFSVKNKKRFYYGVIIFYVLIALLAPFLANERPLCISINGQTFFPAFTNDAYISLPESNGQTKLARMNSIDWKNLKAETKIFAPVCYSPQRSDLLNILSSPFSPQEFRTDGDSIIQMPARYRHFLGTGKTGNDVLAGLIHGTRTSLAIGFLAMTIAMLAGIFLGCIGGYFGDDKLRISRGNFFLLILMIVPAWFYAFYLRSDILSESFRSSFFSGTFSLLVSLLFFSLLIAWPLFVRFPRMSFLNNKIYVPVDSAISRIIEIFLSLPRLVLILTIAAISRPSAISIILIIGLTSWTEIARLMRAQMLQLREMNYIAAAKSIGNNTMSILRRHLLPNALSQVIVVWTFGVASAILVETSLSFLGIGVPVGTATWGTLIFEGRENFDAWWLIAFPGTFVFLLLISLYAIKEFRSERLG